jgi:hypothetical protein
MEPDAALVRAERVVVLDAVALEQLVVPVVHPDREVHHHLVLRLREDDPHAVLEIDQLRRLEHHVDRLEVQVVRVGREPELVEDRVAIGRARHGV